MLSGSLGKTNEKSKRRERAVTERTGPVAERKNSKNRDREIIDREIETASLLRSDVSLRLP